VLLVNDWPKSEFHAPTLSAYVQWSFYSLWVASEETPILSKYHVYQSLIRLFWRSGTQLCVEVEVGEDFWTSVPILASPDLLVCPGFGLRSVMMKMREMAE
jgi:hypothetical protein